MTQSISESTLRRLPVYLRYLRSVEGERVNISAAAVAAHFGLNDVQVRKDLGAASGAGKPKTGYNVHQLIERIEYCLCCGQNTRAILVGAGNLGKALLAYSGFEDYGIEIVAAFDSNPEIIGSSIAGKPVLPLVKLETVCFNDSIALGIIATPEGAAQSTCDRLISCGIRAVWNFAPTFLKAPPYALVENENLASSLALLSRHIRDKGGAV